MFYSAIMAVVSGDGFEGINHEYELKLEDFSGTLLHLQTPLNLLSQSFLLP